MSLHIFVARSQPATRYKICVGDLVWWTRHKRRAQLWARCCKRRRYAQNLVVHVYYDGIWYYCRPGKGCKHKR